MATSSITLRPRNPVTLGFEASDANLYRYVGNAPTNATDPSGLEELPFPTVTPYWTGKHVPQRIWKSERELYPNDPPYFSGRDFVRGFPAALMTAFPRVRVGTTPPAYNCYTYDDTDVRMMQSIVARADIRVNLMHYKVRIANAIGQMLSTTSPSPPSGPVTLTKGETEEIANRVADWYIRSVDDFLGSHWGANPKQGTRNYWFDKFGVQDEQNRPWCDDWATNLLGGADEVLDTKIMVGDQALPLNQLLKTERVQWHGGIPGWRLQHNYLLFRPFGYKVANPPSTDPVIVLFDPWIKIRPEVYSPKTHPYPGANTGIK